MVQQNSDGLNMSTSTNGTDGGNRRWRGRRGKRGKRGLGNKSYCKNSFDNSPDCVNEYYTKLDDNNEIEWKLSLTRWWWNQMKIAWFGWLLIPMAGFMGVT